MLFYFTNKVIIPLSYYILNPALERFVGMEFIAFLIKYVIILNEKATALL